ncbi:MAG: nucleotide-binding domain containing protein, partial [Candidatus Rokuibacteriota bacterium]
GLAVVSVDANRHTDSAPAVAALASGRAALIASVTTPASCEAVAHHLAEAAARVLERAEPDLVAVTGGETAYALIRALRPRRFDLLGAPADGLALGRLTREDGRGLSLLTKAGGFGPADLFTTLLGGTS